MTFYKTGSGNLEDESVNSIYLEDKSFCQSTVI